MTNPNFIGQSGFHFGLGVVEDRHDPSKLGRVRVRVLGLHSENKEEIPTESLPWASPLLPISEAGVSGKGNCLHGLVEGTWVVVFFADGESMQHPIVWGVLPSLAQAQPNPFTGFSDPLHTEPIPPQEIKMSDNGSGTKILPGLSAGYPKPDRLNEPDVHRLARGISSGTMVETIANARSIGQVGIPQGVGYRMGVPVKPLDTFSEPRSRFVGQYPYNHVTESESGHLEEIDDTPGAERLHRAHRTGTFEEIYPDGTKVQKVVNDNYSITMRNDFVHIEGKAVVTVDKGTRILINKDAESGQDLDIEVGENGHISLTVRKGDLNISLLQGDINTFVNGNVNEIITGNHSKTVLGNITEFANGNISSNAAMNHLIAAQLAATTVAGYTITNTAGMAITSIAGLTSTHFATLVYTVQAANTHLNPLGQ